MDIEVIETLVGITLLLITAGVNAVLRLRTQENAGGRLADIIHLARILMTGAQEYANDRDYVGGMEKLALVTSALTTGAKRLGVNLSEDEATAFIHAALLELKESGLVPARVVTEPSGYPEVSERDLAEWEALANAEDAAIEDALADMVDDQQKLILVPDLDGA